MGAGGGKSSTSKSSTSSPYAGLLASFGNIAQPLYGAMANAGAEAFRTGGIGAQQPWIARSTDAARGSLSSSMESTRQALARSNLGNTTFGQQILAELQQKGESDIAQIGPNAAMDFMKMAPNITGQGISATGAAGSLTRSGTDVSTPSFWDIFIKSLQGGAMAGLVAEGA